MLFIDARHIFRQIDRAHRKFSPEQIEFLANIVRLYRGEKPEFVAGEDDEHPGPDPDLKETFPELQVRRCAGAVQGRHARAEIEAQGWSLNPGRYVGVADKAADDFDFAERLEELNEELEVLNSEARELEERIAANVAKLLEGDMKTDRALGRCPRHWSDRRFLQGSPSRGRTHRRRNVSPW